MMVAERFLESLMAPHEYEGLELMLLLANIFSLLMKKSHVN